MMKTTTSIVILTIMTCWINTAQAENLQVLHIGSGPVMTHSFQVGAAVASILSQPEGLPSCIEGQPCGIDGVLAVIRSYDNSVALMKAISTGDVGLAIAPAYVTHAARCAAPVSRFRAPMRSFRILSNLYEEVVHIVIRRDSVLKTVNDLRDKTVAIGPSGSGARIVATLVLNAHGIATREIGASGLAGDDALDALESSAIDAVILSAPVPYPRLETLLANGMTVLPVSGAAIESLSQEKPLFRRYIFPGTAYPSVAGQQSISSPSQLIVHEDLARARGAEISAALWRGPNQNTLRNALPSFAFLSKAESFHALTAPLSEGVMAPTNANVTVLPCS